MTVKALLKYENKNEKFTHESFYFILVEFDELKDEGLLYAERLKEANVDCKIAFYENAFHSNLHKKATK